MIDRTILAVLLGLLGLCYAIQCPKQKTSPGREVVCYTSATDVEQLTDAVCRCTTVVQQGHDVRNLSTSGFQSLRKSLKEINSPVQFMISVDDPGATIKTSGTARQEVTARLIGILKEVDGVELNMTAGSKERLLHFVKGLKDELVRKSMDKRIFLVLPTKSEDLAKQFDLKELSKYVDLFTIATHYLVEDDEAYHTFHPSRLIGLFDMVNADSLIDLISGLGAPKRKILPSLPAGAYRFTLKNQDDNAPRSSTVEMQPDVIDQKELCDLMTTGEWTIERDEDLTAPYAFKNKTWIAFEDKLSVTIKGKYALLRNLPGLAIRDIENDFKTKCGKPLTHEVHHSFTDFKRKSRAAVLNALEDDLHQTQINYPTKVKSSEFRVVRVVDTEGHIQAIRENTQTEFVCTRQGYFVHPKSCNRFYRCVKFNQEVEDYSVFEFDCPAGLAFDERTEVCVWPGSLPQGSPCPGSSEIAPVARVRFECPSQPGYYADPQNPRWFFACIDLGGSDITAYEFRCPFGLIFDEHKLVCEWPWLVPGYSGTGYTRTEYDNQGYDAGATQGSGGSGGQTHGYSGTPGYQTGGYAGTGGYSNTGSSVATGSGFSGAAGVGYGGSTNGYHGSSVGQGASDYSGSTGGYSGSTAGHGAAGGGYSGGATGGHGATGGGYSGGQGAAGSGYSGGATGGHGAIGSGYSGGATGGHGATGGGYSGGQGAAGSGYSGGATGGHGATGSGYSGGATGGHGATGSGYSGGTTGSGYSGGTTGGHGATGSGYSGGATGGHGATGSGYSGGATISGYSGGATGGHGATGGGYSGGATGGQGSTGSGYSGGATGGHGVTGSGYSGGHGATGSGYSGGATGGHGATGSGYSGGATVSGYSGGATGGHGAIGGGYSGGQASTGSGYSGGATGGHGVTGSGYSGGHGATGSGYSGGATGGHDSTGSGYSGGATGGHGATGGGYSGVQTGSHGATGSGYSGSSTEGYGGTGNGYSGSSTGGYDGIGNGYSGSETGGHGSAGSGYSGAGTGALGTTGSGYSGGATGGHGATGGGYSGGSTGSGYSGGATGGHGATGGGYSGGQGATGSGYSGGATGNGYSGDATGGHGSAGTGYSGPSTGGYDRTGNGYSGSKTGGHGGTGSGYSGSSTGVFGGTVSTGKTGSIGGNYGGSTGSGYSGSAGNTGYVGSTSGVFTGSSHIGSDNRGYSGASDNNLFSGTTGAGQVPTGSGYPGAGNTVHFGTSGIYKGTDGTDLTQSTYSGGSGNGYAGSTSGAHAGATGISYTGSTAGGYAGSTSAAHAGATGISYTGPGTGGCKVPTNNIHTGPSQTTYTGPAGGCAGSAGGNIIPVTETTYTGPSVGTDYSTGGYGGSGTKGGGYAGSSSVYYSGPSQGSTIPGYSGGVSYSGSSTSGENGHGYSVQTIHTQPQVPIYATTGVGTTGSGYSGSAGITGAHGQTSGSTFIGQQPETPGVNYISNTPGIGVYHGVSTGSVLPGKSGVTTTYYGNAGTGGYDKGVVTSGTNIYQDGFKGVGNTGGLNITLIGSTPYHGAATPSVDYGITRGTAGAGAIVTGPTIQGSIVTGDSSPGTLYTYGATSGTILSGSSDQGSIITGSSHPGYTKTGAGTPGYVISDGVKTVYPGSASPGTVVYGTPSPGVVLTGAPDSGTIISGQTSPGIVLTGQTAPGVSIGGSVQQGTVIGSTGHQFFTDSAKTGSAYGTKIGSGSYDTGYKTNEYSDNGGRGTVKFNNGDVTTKYTENDIPDYRPAGGTIPPDTLIYQSTPPTPSGFTKTGPTRTGITTATLGGHGSYVINTGGTRPHPNPDKIGETAFDGNVAGFTTSSIHSTTDSSHIDTSKITLGPSKSTGYSYQRPSVPFETGVTRPTAFSVGPTESGVHPATTPTPFLNVEVYNTPKYGESPSDGRPSEGPYRGKVYTDFTRAPVPTGTPVLYTTGPLENYKTTIFEAVKIPVVISTAHPVIDDGYKTVVSPTSIPVTITHDKFGGNIQQTGSLSTQSQFDYGSRTSQQSGYSQGQGYISNTTPSSVFGVQSTYSTKPRPFGFTSAVTVQPEINYGSTVPPGAGYSQSTSNNIYGQNQTAFGVSESVKPQIQYLPGDSVSPGLGATHGKLFPSPGVTYQQSTLVTPSSGGSPTNVEISRDEVGKLITNYNRGSTKYVPNEYDIYTTGSHAGSDYSRSQSSSSSSFGQGYVSTSAPFGSTQSHGAVTAYTGGYSRPSVVSYQTTAKTTAVGHAKVIVKWSDLHPLLLGKLGAECTCRGDPFSNLRGPGSRLINSSKGKVDLANYDESEIYVDLEKDGSYEDKDYVTNLESSSSGPVKIWNNETPAPVPQSGDSQVQENLSSAYLPSVTPSISLHGSLGVSQNYVTGSSNRGFSANYRSGKSLSNVESSTNSAAGKGASFDRYGPGGLRDSEEVLEGATNCARPGLFRHPNFCNKFYACHWDEWKKKFTLHVFNCPVHLTFDGAAAACNWPSMGPACQDDNLLV